MKRDPQLIIRILETLEAEEKICPSNIIHYEDIDQKIIDMHLMLMADGGLIKVQPFYTEGEEMSFNGIRYTPRTIDKVIPLGICWAGYDYLDNHSITRRNSG